LTITLVALKIPGNQTGCSMSANPIRPGDYSPPPPELRHLFGSFAELRARIRARRFPGLGALRGEADPVNPASLRRAHAHESPNSGSED
jgi:hypothetical protein